MAITIYTEEQIANQALAFLRNRFPGKDSSIESFIGKIARMFGMLATGIQKAALDADNNSVPSAYNSSARLEEFAYVFGVPSSTSGSYGRKLATVSGGGVGLSTGTNGTVYTAGTQAYAPDGVTVIQVVSTVTIPGSPPGAGSISTSFAAVTKGTQGNLSAGTILSWISPPSGSDSTVSLSTGLSGAIDAETDAALLIRILERLQQPPKGGTASDYRQWAEAVTGIDRAYVYPLRGGLGTVHVVLAGPGSGSGRDPGATVKTAVDDYINGSSSQEGVRPVTVPGFVSYRPYLVGSGLDIRVRVIPNGSVNDFDWDDGGTALTVVAYTAPASGNPGRIQLSSLPATLAAALPALKSPRLQISASGAGAPVSQQVRAASLFSGTTVNLEEPLPSGFFPPTAGDLIYAGGPVVAQTAAAIGDYIDTLGPSRLSGYASIFDVWEDTAAVARITQVALDQTDANGFMITNNIVPGSPTINGATVDVEATDATSNGPQLLFARWIKVTS